MLRNADKLTLSGGLLYYRHKPKYQIEEVKCFVVPKAHQRTVIDGRHHDAGHQGKKEWRVSSLIDSGGLESSRMSTGPSRIVSDVSFMEGGKKRPLWSL